jgi:N-acetylglucosaminyldiphosphoundecaprenol N-acetyl-beta-D-mannosaminyltransferase
MDARLKILGMEIDAISMPQAVSKVLGWIEEKDHWCCRYIVTPNVNHTVKFQENEQFRQAYAGASLVLADGKPVVLASRLLGRPLPQTVPGSDLVPALFEACQAREGLRVFFLGAASGVAERAALRVQTRWAGIKVVGQDSPAFGFEKNESENRKILQLIRDSVPDILVVGLGAPKQELWVYQHIDEINAKVALCVGATIDFLAGEKVRAPMWLRNLGLEWLHRMLTEPRRLFWRYARDAWIFPRLVWREWRGSWLQL